MKRLEIIANRSVEDDLYDAFKRCGVETPYTLVPVVHGFGHQGPRRGDGTWPEENFLMIIYCDENMAEKIRGCVLMVKETFPTEGIKLFELG